MVVVEMVERTASRRPQGVSLGARGRQPLGEEFWTMASEQLKKSYLEIIKKNPIPIPIYKDISYSGPLLMQQKAELMQQHLSYHPDVYFEFDI